ncbi:hypothetical protein MRX96_016249 [Rhipicephalus microplus]
MYVTLGATAQFQMEWVKNETSMRRGGLARTTNDHKGSRRPKLGTSKRSPLRRGHLEGDARARTLSSRATQPGHSRRKADSHRVGLARRETNQAGGSLPRCNHRDTDKRRQPPDAGNINTTGSNRRKEGRKKTQQTERGGGTENREQMMTERGRTQLLLSAQFGETSGKKAGKNNKRRAVGRATLQKHAARLYASAGSTHPSVRSIM